MIPLTGIGNPLLDVIMHTDYETLHSFKVEAGTMNLVDSAYSERLLGLRFEKSQTPGGSCANTLRGVAWLFDEEEKAFYMGAVGKDSAGDGFERILKGQGVVSGLARKDVPTGVSAILVTPDHERTMFTYLGACREFTLDDVDFKTLEEARILYIAGYMWDTQNQKEATKGAIEHALDKGVRIAFDLADPFVVHRFGEELREYLPGKLSLLFANKEELSVMTGLPDGSDEEVLRAGSYLADTVIMKIGARGCMILDGGESVTIPGEKVRTVDTTAAGDSFASGFLYGLLRGKEMHDCGLLANRLASRIVTVEGCNYSLLDREDVLSILDGK